MQRRTFLIAGASFATFGIRAEAAGTAAQLYKEPACGCCGGYANHLRRHGIDVTVTETEGFAKIGREAGVPADLEGCHVTFVGGYAISGHVPIEAVRKVLAEKPLIAGLTLKGMPAGSPGMPGPKTEAFVVYSFTRDGRQPVIFAVY